MKLSVETLYDPEFWRCRSSAENPYGNDTFLRQVSAETGIPFERLKRRWMAFLRGEIAENVQHGSDRSLIDHGRARTKKPKFVSDWRNRPYAETSGAATKRRELAEALVAFIQKNNAFVTSLPGTFPIRVEIPKENSTLVSRLIDLGYSVGTQVRHKANTGHHHEHNFFADRYFGNPDTGEINRWRVLASSTNAQQLR